MASSSSSSTPPPLKTYFGYGSNLWLDQMARRCPSSPHTGVGVLRGYKWFINSRGYANIAPSEPQPSKNFEKEEEKEKKKDKDEEEDEVWGLIYDLTPADEAQLDLNEGVPVAYEKRTIPVLFKPKKEAAKEQEKEEGKEEDENDDDDDEDEVKGWKTVDMLVYIDFKRNEGGFEPRAEYVYRMNMGIRDALKEGVPKSYVDAVLRKYIPDDGGEEEEEGEEEGEEEEEEEEYLTLRQALDQDLSLGLSGNGKKKKKMMMMKDEARRLALQQAALFRDESGVITPAGGIADDGVAAKKEE